MRIKLVNMTEGSEQCLTLFQYFSSEGEGHGDVKDM